jgi:hypothetical protein
MFKLDEKRRYINVPYNKSKIAEFPLPNNRKYPETKEEVKKALIKSVKTIEVELRYVIGILHFAKAPMLKPFKKSSWYEDLIPLYFKFLNLFIYLGIHPVQQDDQGEDYRWESKLDKHQK